jgi:hypothetical protein
MTANPTADDALKKAVWSGYEAMDEPCGKPEHFLRALRAAGYAIVAAQPDAGAMVEATDDLVDRFAAALKAKLRAAEQKYGYSDDWLRDDWQGELIAKLLHHIQKGDPRDVAAYCAFAWHHGWSITPYTHANPRRAIRELKLIATAEVDPKVREGIDRAIQHLESMVQP